MDRTKKHRLPDMGTIAICAVICGTDGWVQVEQFARPSRIALSLLKGRTRHKVGLKTKRPCCGWRPDYLLRVFTRVDRRIQMRSPCHIPTRALALRAGGRMLMGCARPGRVEAPAAWPEASMTEPSYRVLIVEDEPDINNLLAEILTAYGMEPIQVHTGEDALLTVRKDRPDAIILDLMLPGLSGYAVCRQLKTARATRGIPVVILTALDRLSDRREAYETGADEYVTKPFSPDTFMRRLQACIERVRAVEGRHHVSMTFELEASITGLKAVNTLVTALYCQTPLEEPQVEALRSGIIRLAAAAGTWAAAHGGAPPAHLTFDLEEGRLKLAFDPAGETGRAFLNTHLDPEAVIPAEFTDAGVIDRRTDEGETVVLEKLLPPEDA